MANSILTPTMITREALRVLHQKLNFVGNVNRQYDDQFAKSGAKIGQTLNVRMPSKYTVRTGAAASYQDHVERSTPLSVSSQYGVDLSFSSVDLTMSLDDFSRRVVDPAMSQLAAKIEGDCLSDAFKLVNNYTNGTTNTMLNYSYFQGNGKNITKQLAPLANRAACLSPDSVVNFADAVKGLFHDESGIKRAYREGMLGRTGGFDVYENTLIPTYTGGTLAGSPVLDGANQGTTTTANTWVSQTTVSVSGATAGTTLKAGDIITLGTAGSAGLYKIHPETKAETGGLATFVVQSDITMTTAATTYAVTVKPGIMSGSGNAYQNVYASGSTDGLAMTKIGAAGAQLGNDLFFHSDAFVFATADLEDVSRYGAWGARESMDGISMRLARQYDIASDNVPGRIDVLFGFAGLYPELASRHLYETDLV